MTLVDASAVLKEEDKNSMISSRILQTGKFGDGNSNNSRNVHVLLVSIDTHVCRKFLLNLGLQEAKTFSTPWSES